MPTAIAACADARSAARRRARPDLPELRPELCEARERRAELEVFIARRYREVYGAELTQWMPRLFGLYGRDGQVLAAFGLRCAATGPLFLEQYLDRPVEEWAAARSGRTVARGELVEIGNLAGRHPGALRLLIALLAGQLDRCDYRWACFTVPPVLANGFSRLGLPLERLAPARLERLPEGQRASWGRYFDSDPWVMLGDIRGGRRLLLQGEAFASITGVDPAVPCR